MNWKTAVLGGLAMYVLMFAISMGTGVVVHEGILEADYKATSDFWRPELRSEPPDMGALMPRWITTGLITTCIIAGMYGIVHKGLGGPGWRRGLVYGAMVSTFMCVFCAGWSGVFDLPDKIWIVWGLESFAYYLPGGALLGWLHERFFS